MSVKSEIESAVKRGAIALKEKGSLKAVQEAMVEPYHADTARTEMVPFPPVPAPVVLTEEAKKALADLPNVFAVVQPETRRTLTEDEMKAVYAERQALKEIVTLLTGRDESLKTIIRHHMDVSAEERNVAVPKAKVDPVSGEVIVEATDRSADGHYILASPKNPERVHIPGTNQDWSREYRSGTTSLDESVIEDLYKSNQIDREVYLAMTREKRVFDAAKAMDVAVNKPDLRAAILDVIRQMTIPGKPGTSLFTRKQQ